MDALVTECSYNADVIVVKIWMQRWLTVDSQLTTGVWFGHGCIGNWKIARLDSHTSRVLFGIVLNIASRCWTSRRLCVMLAGIMSLMEGAKSRSMSFLI